MNDHYFSADPASPHELRTLHLRLAGHEVEMQTAPGVFCPDRLDSGTSVLLQHAPQPPADGVFLDIGCGWGPITTTLGLLSPDAEVYGVDVNRRSLQLARDNAVVNGCRNVTISLPSEVPGDVRFNLIWSNPPIRVGKKVLHELLLTWLPRLRIDGQAYLVVQRNLGSDSLHKWLTETLGDAYEVVRFTSVKGFRILKVSRLSDGGPTPLTPSDNASH